MVIGMCSRWGVLAVIASLSLHAQVIDFESNGLHYKTLTKGGVTVMFAHLAAQVKDYAIVQVTISNGSPISWVVRPEDFTFQRNDGSTLQATPALTVVNSFIHKAGRHDVIKLVATYEASLYGNTKMQSTNGYEIRRQNALAEVSSAKLKAAAAASAICLVPVKLVPGQTTDGAIFFESSGKPLGSGHLLLHAAGETFDFESGDEPRF